MREMRAMYTALMAAAQLAVSSLLAARPQQSADESAAAAIAVDVNVVNANTVICSDSMSGGR